MSTILEPQVVSYDASEMTVPTGFTLVISRGT